MTTSDDPIIEDESDEMEKVSEASLYAVISSFVEQTDLKSYKLEREVRPSGVVLIHFNATFKIS